MLYQKMYEQDTTISIGIGIGDTNNNRHRNSKQLTECMQTGTIQSEKQNEGQNNTMTKEFLKKKRLLVVAYPL